MRRGVSGSVRRAVRRAVCRVESRARRSRVSCAVSRARRRRRVSGTGSRRGVVSRRMVAGLLVTHELGHMKAQSGRVDASVPPDEQGSEDRFRQKVQDSVEDGLGIRGNDVAALTDAPGDRIHDPQEAGQGTAVQERTADVGAEKAGVPAGRPGEVIQNIKESNHAKGEVAPLVRRLDKCANQAYDDHDEVDRDDRENGRPRHSSREQQVQQEQRRCDHPVNVASIENRPVLTADSRAAALELDFDWRKAQIGTHREVRQARHHTDSACDVVEDASTARLRGSQAKEGEGRNTHDGTNGEVEAGAMRCDGDVGSGAIDVVVIDAYSAVATLEDIHLTEFYHRAPAGC